MPDKPENPECTAIARTSQAREEQIMFSISGIKIAPNGIRCGDCRGRSYTPGGPAWHESNHCQFFDQSLVVDSEGWICPTCKQRVRGTRLRDGILFTEKEFFRCQECISAEKSAMEKEKANE